MLFFKKKKRGPQFRDHMHVFLTKWNVKTLNLSHLLPTQAPFFYIKNSFFCFSWFWQWAHGGCNRSAKMLTSTRHLIPWLFFFIELVFRYMDVCDGWHFFLLRTKVEYNFFLWKICFLTFSQHIHIFITYCNTHINKEKLVIMLKQNS